jgi:TP901 family phage tail tape measure protein
LAGVRELYLVLRARNETASAFRQVARDVRALPDVERLRTGLQQAQARVTSLQRQRQELVAQRESLQTGEKYLANVERINNAQARINRELGNRRAIEGQITAAVDQRASAQLRLEAMQRRQTQKMRLPRGVTGRMFAEQIEQQRSTVTRHDENIGRLTASYRENATAVGNAEAHLLRMRAANVATEASIAGLTGRIGEMDETLSIARRGVDDFKQRISNLPMQQLGVLASTIGHIGRVMATTGTIVAAGFALMARSAANFGQQATLAATQAGTSYNAVRKYSGAIQKDVLGQMGRFPAASEEMTRGFYDILSSMDVNTKGANTMMNAFNRTAVAGMAPLNDVVNAGITIMNNFNMQASQAPAAMNQLLATVRYGRLNVQQYTQSLNQLVPAFAGAGQTALQMNAAFAQLTRQMPNQRMAATSLARLMDLFGKPEFQQGVQQFGIQITDAYGRMRPFTDIMRQFGTSMNPTIVALREGRLSAGAFFKEISNTTSTAQARRGFQLLITHSGQLSLRLRQIRDDANELPRSYAAMSKTPAVQWATFTNQLKAFAVVIGQGVIPAISMIGKAILPVVRWFERLSPSTQHLIGYFGALSAVFVTMAGAVLMLVGSFAAFLLSIRQISQQLTIMRGATAAANGQLALFAAESGFAGAGLLRWMGVISLILVALPFLNKVTHSTAVSIGLLAAAFAAFNLVRLIMGIRGMASAMRLFMLSTGFIGALGIAILLIATHWEQTKKVMMLLWAWIQRIFVPGWQAMLQTLKAAMYGLLQYFTIVLRGLLKLATYFPWGKISDPAKRALKNINDFISRFKPDYGKVSKTWERYGALTADAWANMFKKTVKKNGPKARDFEMLPGVATGQAALAKLPRAVALPDILEPGPAIQMAQRLANLKAQIERMTPGPHQFVMWQRYNAQLAMYNKLVPEATRKIIEMMNIQARQPTITDQQVLALQRQIDAAGKAFAATPTHANWVRWFNLQDRLARTATDRQKQLASDYSQIWANAQPTVSNQAALAMARNVRRLQQVQSQAPSLANWTAWYNANKRMMASLTDEQQQMVQDLILNQQNVTVLTNAEFRRRYAIVDRMGKQAEDATKRHAANAFELQVRYHTALDKLNADATSAQMAAMNALEDARKQKNDDAVKNAQQSLKSITDTFVSTYDSIRQQNQQAMGTLFEGPYSQSSSVQLRRAWGLTGTPGDLLQDLKSQVTGFQRFHGSLGQLARRGAPRQLIDQIREMGPAAQDNVNQLLRMSPAQWRQYVQVFQRGQREIERATQRQMNAQIRQWFIHGRKVARAIIDGVSSQNVALQNAMKNLVLQLFPGLAHRAGARPAAAAVGGNTYNYTIHAAPGATVTLPTTLRKLHMLDKNRRGPRAR